MGYRLAKVSRTGLPSRFLPTAVVTEGPTWEQNTFGRLTFDLGLFDPANSVLRKYDEVCVVSGPSIIWWGPVVTTETRLDGDTAVRTYRCADLNWYWDHRFVGKASRTNYAVDPDFEAPPGDPDYGAWASVGTFTTFDPYSSDIAKLHTHSLKIVNPTADQDWFAYEDILAFTTTGVGDLLTAVAWYYVLDDGSFTGEALGNGGLALIPFNGGTAEPQPTGFADIRGDTPKGSWQRLKCTIWLPPSVTRDLQVRLYAPGGTIYWDAVQVVRMESLSSVSSPTDFTNDQAFIMEHLVQHAQDPAVGKDDVNIGTNCPATGVRRERHYQYADHANILRALQEFPGLDNGCDFWIDWAALNDGFGSYARTFRTGFPHRETVRDFAFGLRMVVGPQYDPTSPYAIGNIAVTSYSHTDDGDQGVTSVTVLGDGDGPDREEAGAVLASPPLIVEEVMAAPVSTDIDALAGVAAEELKAKQNPDIWQVIVARPDWIGVVMPGDTLPVYFQVVDSAAGTVESYYQRVRVTSAAADLDAGTLALSLNQENP